MVHTRTTFVVLKEGECNIETVARKVAESLNCEEEAFILLDSRNQEIQDCPATQGNSLSSDIRKHPLDVLTLASKVYSVVKQVL